MARTKTLTLPRRSRLALVLIVLVIATLLVFSELGHQRALAGLDSNERLLLQRVSLQRLQRLMLEAETDQRGFLLTGQPTYRAAFERVAAEVDVQLGHVARLYQDDADRRAAVADITELTRRRMAELQTTRRMYEAGKTEAAYGLVATGMGLEYMQALEQQLTRLASVERSRSDANLEALRNTLTGKRLGLLVLVVLSFAALGLFVRQTLLAVASRERQRRALHAQRDALELQVAHRTQELTEIATHLQRAREDERSRLARELHDELGALLTTAKLDVARIKRRLPEAAPEVTERIAHLVGTLDAGIALKRQIIEDLRPSTLSHLGLSTALEVLCREFTARGGMNVTPDLDELELNEDQQLTVYRLVQESLTNAAKYAQAQHVGVSLKAHPEGAWLSVVDDGVGFDLQAVPMKAHGLAGMRFRVGSAGGRLRIQSAPGQGTSIEAVLPLGAAVAASGPAPLLPSTP